MMANGKYIVVQTSKGGAGKTTVTEAIRTVLVAGGLRVLVADVDAGNSGYTRRTADPDSVKIPWTTGPDKAVEWCYEKAKAFDVIIVDAGANLSVSEMPVNAFLGRSAIWYKENGWAVFAMGVESPNAPGSARLAENMKDTLGNFCDFRLVRNNQDGSGEFEVDIHTLGVRRVDVGRIKPGVQAVRMRYKRPLLNLLMCPPEGYARAMANLAEWLVEFADQAEMRDIFEPAAIEEIKKLAPTKSNPQYFHIGHANRATDLSMELNCEAWKAMNLLRKMVKNGASDGDIGAQAKSYFEIESKYYSI